MAFAFMDRRMREARGWKNVMFWSFFPLVWAAVDIFALSGAGNSLNQTGWVLVFMVGLSAAIALRDQEGRIQRLEMLSKADEKAVESRK
jgi:hypothetical protein